MIQRTEDLANYRIKTLEEARKEKSIFSLAESRDIRYLEGEDIDLKKVISVRYWNSGQLRFFIYKTPLRNIVIFSHMITEKNNTDKDFNELLI